MITFIITTRTDWEELDATVRRYKKDNWTVSMKTHGGLTTLTCKRERKS